MKNYYSILQISRTATVVEIKGAYRTLSKKYHPDINKAPNASLLFIEIKEAYEVLIDDSRRLQYNQMIDFAAQKHRENINVTPTISVFYCDTAQFSVGDVVMFTWEVFDADMVELRPFGKVSNSGTKKIKITEVSKNLLVELFCFNSVSRNYVFSQMVLVKREAVIQNGNNWNVFINENKTEQTSSQYINQEDKFDSNKINLFNLKFNKPSKLAIMVFVISMVNLLSYIICPFFYIQESQVVANKAFSKNINGYTSYFIEFDDFTIETTNQMAEALQKMDERVVFFGVNTNTNNVDYLRIETDINSIKQNVSSFNQIDLLICFYIVFIIFQFYLIFINDKFYLNDQFDTVLGFFFAFNLGMTYAIYKIIF